jgi:DNA modification methylase
VKVILHSCGNILPFIPDLIEVGVDALNPLEVKAGMDPYFLKDTYGDKLVLWGGCSALNWREEGAVMEDVEKLMGGEKADMVLSDPPYGMFLDTDFSSCIGSIGSIGRKNQTKGNKYDKVIGDNEDFTPKLITTFFENFSSCKEVFLFGADYFAELLESKNDGSWLVWDKRKESQADAIGSEFELIWSKNKHKRRVLRHDWFGFLSSQNSIDARNRVHPTQKPISLLVDIIEQWGKNSERIVDLYGGSGSTLIAAEQKGKLSFLMEIDPKYCDVIIARWEKFTGKQAVKLN